MENSIIQKEGELISSLQNEEPKYQNAIHGDLAFDHVKPFCLKLKELKEELDEITRKTELLNERFATEIDRYENCLKKLNEFIEANKNS